VIVLDASAALAGLLNDGPARQALRSEQLHAPYLIDSEIANVIRRHVRAGMLDATVGWLALDTWRRLGVRRYAVISLLDRIWELRENLSAYDASYVTLAEAIGCPLVTADARLSHAPGMRCPITVVPR
jgi:predicted nucleic acid-binding protein